MVTTMVNISPLLHVWYICQHLPPFCDPNVGKYSTHGAYGISKMITLVAGRCGRNWQDVAGSCRWVGTHGKKIMDNLHLFMGVPKIRMVLKKAVKPPCQVWLMYWLAWFKPLQPTSWNWLLIKGLGNQWARFPSPQSDTWVEIYTTTLV